MRLLFIAERYPPDRGGLARSAARIAAGIAGRGVEVHVLTCDRDVSAGDMDSAESGGIVVHRMGVFREDDRTRMSMGLAIGLLHKRHPFDLLVGMYLVAAGYVAALEAGMLDLPSLVMARGNDVDREIFRPSGMHYAMGALKMATAVGCVSVELMKKCRVLAGREGVYYTPNSVDSSTFTPGEPDAKLKSKYGLCGPVVGFSGELRFKKGMNQMLAAAEHLAEEFPGIKFLLLGGVRGDSEKEYRELMKSSPALKEVIVETPYIDNPGELCRHYRLMDVLFMPSYWEGMPNACLEAFACGVPVVGSTAGALAELIEPGVNGFSFTPGDFTAALEELGRALSLTPERRREMGGLARDMVAEKYSPEMETDRIMEIIGEIL